ncbi:MAG TPA: aspartate aminotransferase family protein [Desulfatirhabdiaceae bacterium]|nr:aspartate aminotransferase family protein [Desulfatirhabdiaceae bacterium]
MTESNVFTRKLDRNLPVAVKAEGVWITDASGKRYLDASGGPICVNVGHGRAEVADAMAKQARNLAYVHGTMFTSGPVEELARRLSIHADRGLNRFYFLSSGSEAVEASIKLARQIHIASGNSSRHRVISRWQSYHGATLGALSVTGKPSMRDPFLPMIPSSIHIPPPYCLRCHYGLAYPSCGIRCATALEDTILLEGKNTISAFVAETIGGATIGAMVPPVEYYPLIETICRKHGVILILDEVMSGMGRTGRWFGMHHYAVNPDIITLGKGLNGGYAALSAVGCREEHVRLIREKSGNFVHGHTFSHHAVGAAAALAVVGILEREQLVEQADLRGQYLKNRLLRLKNHPNIGDIRGIGLMRAIEFVMDKQNMTPFPRTEKITERLTGLMFQNGMITYPCTGFANGAGDGIMLSPPYIVSEAEVDQIVDTLESAIHEVFP